MEITTLLNIGKIGSGILGAMGAVLCMIALISSASTGRNTSWMTGAGQFMIIDGIGFFTFFFAMEIIYTNMGLI